MSAARLAWGEFMWLVKLRTICFVVGHRWGHWFNWRGSCALNDGHPGPLVRSRICDRCGDCQHIDL